MNRIQLACCCLIASAVVLAGLLVTQLGDRVGGNEAQAAQVIARDNFTLMTAMTRSGEEALFVLDNSSGVLVVYNLNVSRKQLEPTATMNLDVVFGVRN